MEQVVEYTIGNATIQVTRVFAGKKTVSDLVLDAVCRAAAKEDRMEAIGYDKETGSNKLENTAK